MDGPLQQHRRLGTVPIHQAVCSEFHGDPTHLLTHRISLGPPLYPSTQKGRQLRPLGHLPGLALRSSLSAAPHNCKVFPSGGGTAVSTFGTFLSQGSEPYSLFWVPLSDRQETLESETQLGTLPCGDRGSLSLWGESRDTPTPPQNFSGSRLWGMRTLRF